MIQRAELLNKIQNGAKWDVAVAIKRGNPLPLDSTSIFESYEKALEYASTSPFAYPTQIIGVANEDGTNEYYGITQAGRLEEIGGKVDVDDMSVIIDNEKISLRGYGKQYYKYVTVLESVDDVASLDPAAEEGSYCKAGAVWYVKGADAWATAESYPTYGDNYILTQGFVEGLQPRVVLGSSANLELGWFEPSTITVEGLSQKLSQLTNDINKTQEEVDKAATDIKDIDDRVDQAIKEIDFNSDDGYLNTHYLGTHSPGRVDLRTVTHGVTYDEETLKLTIPQYGQDDLIINIPKDKFLRTGRYEAEYDFGGGVTGPAIVLVVDDEDSDTDESTKEIAIPASALVDVYTGQTTATAKVSVGEDNVIKVDVNFSEIAEDHIVTVDSLGNPKDSGKTIENIVNAIAQAKEEVEAKITQLSNTVTEMNEKLAKIYIGEGAADELIVSTADGIARSGKKVGGAELAETPDAVTLATEAAVKAALDKALTWGELE